jgi:hypothetical protein
LLDHRITHVAEGDAGEAMCHDRGGRRQRPFAGTRGVRCHGGNHGNRRWLWRGPVQAPSDGGEYDEGEDDTGELGAIHPFIVRKQSDLVEGAT